MEIIQLSEAQKAEALALAQESLQSSFGAKSISAIISFLKERIGSFEVKGAYEDDRLSGFIIYDRENSRIVFTIVKPGEEGRGTGTALLDAVREEASALHFPRISVNAPKALQTFYQNYGFEETEKPQNEGEAEVQPMEYLLGREYIGKTVTVIIDRPYGSFHPHHPDVIYPLNYGYVNELVSADGEFQDAYVYGLQEPAETFTGIVSGIIYHKDGPSRFIVTRPGEMIDHDEVIEAVAFEEQYYDTRFIWNNELN